MPGQWPLADNDLWPDYWPYYCEENVWRMAQTRARVPGYAMFISNAQAQVIMLAQRAGRMHDGLVCWDYHVVWVQFVESQWRVFDFDFADATSAPQGGAGAQLEADADGITEASLPGSLGVSFNSYFQACFPPLEQGYASYRPLFRLIPGDTFAREFSSDRSHMRGTDGSWQQPPPPWPCIGVGNRLTQYRTMHPDEVHTVYTMDTLTEFLRSEREHLNAPA